MMGKRLFGFILRLTSTALPYATQPLSHVLSASDLASMAAEEAHTSPARSMAPTSEPGGTPSTRMPESPIEEVMTMIRA